MNGGREYDVKVKCGESGFCSVLKQARVCMVRTIYIMVVVCVVHYVYKNVVWV